jgi:hypothetical protein
MGCVPLAMLLAVSGPQTPEVVDNTLTELWRGLRHQLTCWFIHAHLGCDLLLSCFLGLVCISVCWGTTPVRTEEPALSTVLAQTKVPRSLVDAHLCPSLE